MDWEQAQRLSEQISVAINDGMQAGFAHLADREDAREERVSTRDFFAGCIAIGILVNSETPIIGEDLACQVFKRVDAMMEKRV